MWFQHTQTLNAFKAKLDKLWCANTFHQPRSKIIICPLSPAGGGNIGHYILIIHCVCRPNFHSFSHSITVCHPFHSHSMFFPPMSLVGWRQHYLICFFLSTSHLHLLRSSTILSHSWLFIPLISYNTIHSY